MTVAAAGPDQATGLLLQTVVLGRCGHCASVTCSSGVLWRTATTAVVVAAAAAAAIRTCRSVGQLLQRGMTLHLHASIALFVIALCLFLTGSVRLFFFFFSFLPTDQSKLGDLR